MEASPEIINGEVVQWVGLSTNIHNEKLYRQALEESEDQLQRGYQMAKLVRCTYFADLNRFSWGDDARQVLHLPATAEIDRLDQLQQYFHPDDVETALGAFRKGRETGHFEVEHRIVPPEGGECWVRVTGDFEEVKNTGQQVMKGVVQDITRQKENEIALYQAKTKLTNMVDSFDDILFTVDNDFTISSVYGSWLHKFGFTKNEFIGKTVTQVFSNISETAIERLGDEALRIGSASEEVVLTKAAGEQCHYLLKLTRLVNKQGQGLGLLAVGRDITDLKKITTEVIENDKRLKALVDATEAVLFEYVIGKGGQYYSGRTAELFEYTPEEMMKGQQLWAKCVIPEDRELFDHTIEDFKVNGSYDVSYRICTPSGKQKWVREIAAEKDTKDPNTIRGIVFDITTEKQLQEQYSKSQQEYQRMFETTSEGYLLMDGHGTVISLNPAGAKLLAIDSLSAQPVNFIKEILCDEAQFDQLRKTVDAEGLVSGEYAEVSNASGKAMIFNLSVAQYPGEEMAAMYEVFFHDVTNDYQLSKLTTLSNELYKSLESMDYHETVQHTVDIFEHLSNSQMAFFHLVNPNQETIRLQQWSTNTKRVCEVPELVGHYPISEAGVWVECVALRQPVIHNDYQALKHKKGLPNGHAYLVRDMEVPIIENDKVVAIIGVANKPFEYTQYDVDLLQSFSMIFWSVLQRKKESQKLIDTTQQYQSLISNVRGIVYQCDLSKDYSMYFISDACLEITGYEASDFYNSPHLFSQLIHPDDREEVWHVINKSAKSGGAYNVSYRLITKEGKTKWVDDRGMVKYDGDYQCDILEGVITDITDRVKHQEELLSVTLDTELNERSRIAKELHDGLQQTLSSGFLHFETLAKRLNNQKGKNEVLIQKVRDLLGQSAEEARDIAHRLLPKILEDHSLLHALLDLFEEYESLQQIHFNHNLRDEDVFEKNIEHALYRIIQEALTNVMKYANASRFDVQLMAYNDQVIVTLDDDGDGFEIQELDLSKSGFGLRSMKSRAHSVGGYCQIDASKGRGTHILVNIPLTTDV